MSHLVFCFPQTRFGGGRYTHTGGLVVFTLLVRGVTGPEGMVGDVACVWIRLLTERGDGHLPLGGKPGLWVFLFSLRAFLPGGTMGCTKGNRISTPPSRNHA